MPEYYHQLGGRGTTLRDWTGNNYYDFKSVAKDLFSYTRGAPLEMVLGIKESGASYLLLHEDTAIRIARQMRYKLPNKHSAKAADQFFSLSPVVFSDSTKLDKKLSALTPKKAAGGQDNSQANKPYMHSTKDGVYRAMFEHNRVLHRIMKGEMTDCRDFGLRESQATRMKGLRMVSLTFTDWIEQPGTYLDIGYSIGETDTYHMNLKQNDRLCKELRSNYVHGASETLDNVGIEKRLLNLFAVSDPTMLLVWNEERTRDLLRNRGVAVGQGWHTGLSPLFSYSSSQEKRPLPKLTYGQVYIVDVQKLVQALFHTQQDTQNVQRAASGLLKLPIQIELTEGKEKQCAGNDARTIIDIWRSLVEGNAIDEQREERKFVPPAVLLPPQTAPVPAPTPDEYDSDVDPNDVPVAAAPAAPAPAQTGYDWESDEDDEW